MNTMSDSNLEVENQIINITEQDTGVYLENKIKLKNEEINEKICDCCCTCWCIIGIITVLFLCASVYHVGILFHKYCPDGNNKSFKCIVVTLYMICSYTTTGIVGLIAISCLSVKIWNVMYLLWNKTINWYARNTLTY